MSIRTFYETKPERSLGAYERWEPATEQTYPGRSVTPFTWEQSAERGEEPGFVVSYEGLCVADREQNMYHDSYFYVTYFDPETGGFESKEYGSTAYVPTSRVTIDAPEALKQYHAEVQQEAWAKYHAELAAEQAAKEAATPSKGKVVKVVKGRKIPIGTEAEVFWYGETGYGWRVGLALTETGEKVFTAASNVEVLPGLTVVSLPEGEAVIVG